jgi:hypothetical protein
MGTLKKIHYQNSIPKNLEILFFLIILVSHALVLSGGTPLS